MIDVAANHHHRPVPHAGSITAPHRWWGAALSLKVEIGLGFGIVIALMLVLGVVFHLSAERSVFAINKLLRSDARMADLSLRSAQAMLRARRAESDFLLSVDRLGVAKATDRYVSALQSELVDMREYLTSFRIIASDLGMSDSGMVEKITRIEQQSQQYESGFLAFVEEYRKAGLAASGDHGQPAYVAAALAMEPLLESLHATATKLSIQTRNGVESAVQITRWTVFVTVAIATMLGAIVAVIVSRRINGSVMQLIVFSKRVAAGDLSARAAHGGEREFATLADAMNQMAEAIESSHRLLRETQSQLLAAARQAGMAEIASNVLHNVGNVLNSVNVSAGMVISIVRESKGRGLARAAQLMNEHTADLGEFLTRDERGKLLPGYLNKLVTALAAEQQSLIDELGALTKSVDHIKAIVATQQSYAGTTSLVEAVQTRDLFEDALRMIADALARREIRVVKEFADLPSLLLDKARLLQILVNLLNNAKQALDGALDRPRRLTLRVDVADPPERPTLRIHVEDNGEGIPPENMTRLFVHGFTTRADGHGFGLHSCALAAKEMGGSLAAHSDGPGMGATFTLELPFRPAGGVP